MERLIGKTFTEVVNNEDRELIFKSPTDAYMFHHEQDCCEDVYIEQIDGDLSDLVNTPILEAREDISSPEIESQYDSETWTFYNFRTIKGSVTVKWVGRSNGYYSESVSFCSIN